MRFEKWLRLGIGLASPIIVVSCAGTSAPPTAAPPTAPPVFYVEGGKGSERGNFASYPDSETTGPSGVHCVIYVWDRPLTDKTALRLRSQSCEQPDHPGLYIANELERTVIPLTSSTLFQGEN